MLNCPDLDPEIAGAAGWEAPKLALHLVTPAGGPRPVRVEVLVDFLATRFGGGMLPWAGGA
jgi:hypothetical protein